MQRPCRRWDGPAADRVTAATPPTLVLVGSKDHLTPPGGARELADELDRHGVANRLVIAPAADHGMDANVSDVPARVNRVLVQQWFNQHAR